MYHIVEVIVCGRYVKKGLLSVGFQQLVKDGIHIPVVPGYILRGEAAACQKLLVNRPAFTAGIQHLAGYAVYLPLPGVGDPVYVRRHRVLQDWVFSFYVFRKGCQISRLLIRVQEAAVQQVRIRIKLKNAIGSSKWRANDGL